MFTGIIEEVGIIKNITRENSNLVFEIECSFINELKIDQSIAHNGVCLTLTNINDNTYQVTIIDETLRKSNLGLLKIGNLINLERSMSANSRFDGHIVQGHVDQTAICTEIVENNGSWIFTFNYENNFNNLTVEKGSVCVNGVSLTVINSKEGKFSVAIIPYTFEHTNFKQVKANSIVNIEFDIIGKYVREYMKKMELVKN